MLTRSFLHKLPDLAKSSRFFWVLMLSMLGTFNFVVSKEFKLITDTICVDRLKCQGAQKIRAVQIEQEAMSSPKDFKVEQMIKVWFVSKKGIFVLQWWGRHIGPNGIPYIGFGPPSND